MRRCLLLDLLVPPRCAACGGPGDTPCAACRRGLPFLGPGLCPRCGLPSDHRRCPAARAAFDAAWAPVAYADAAAALVRAVKDRGALGAVEAMAAPIVAGAPPGLLDGVLVAVPAHPGRRARRGHDPAALLAAALARRTGLELRAVLRRRADRVHQRGASRADRLAGRLDVRSRGPAPRRVVLVDDVHTTGATLDACARALRDAGAREVVAVTYARTLDRGGAVRHTGARSTSAGPDLDGTTVAGAGGPA